MSYHTTTRIAVPHDRGRTIERPDGFYWRDHATGEEFGPFASLVEAFEDMEYLNDGELEVGETVQQAEAEIGIAEWIDAETGLPAEESVPRFEDY